MNGRTRLSLGGWCLCICTILALAGTGYAGVCPGEGNCIAPGGNGTPGCENEDCCNTVCAADAFCCDTSWDGICADEAADLCLFLCTADTNDDNFVNVTDLINVISGWGGSGLGDTNRDGTIDVTDLIDVISQWGPCPNPACPGTGNCFDPFGNGTPGCEDVNCCNLVCATDSFCCDISWDGICSEEAADLCGNEACGPDAGDCTTANGSPGCDSPVCCNYICSLDSFCCNSSWDSICADEAINNCFAAACCFADLSCQDFLTGVDCQAAGGIFQGPNTFCSEIVCEPCTPIAGDCAVANGTPGCDDVDCCNAVCFIDAFCCDTEWDGICAGEAAIECFLVPGCGPDAGDCAVANGTPGCDAPACCNTVCGLDPFCCDNEWDSICAGEAATECFLVPGCGADAGDCSIANGTPGCNDPACCNLVCGLDAFCCDTEWDSVCAGEALDNCVLASK